MARKRVVSTRRILLVTAAASAAFVIAVAVVATIMFRNNSIRSMTEARPFFATEAFVIRELQREADARIQRQDELIQTYRSQIRQLEERRREVETRLAAERATFEAELALRAEEILQDRLVSLGDLTPAERQRQTDLIRNDLADFTREERLAFQQSQQEELDRELRPIAEEIEMSAEELDEETGRRAELQRELEELRSAQIAALETTVGEPSAEESDQETTRLETSEGETTLVLENSSAAIVDALSLTIRRLETELAEAREATAQASPTRQSDAVLALEAQVERLAARLESRALEAAELEAQLERSARALDSAEEDSDSVREELAGVRAEQRLMVEELAAITGELADARRRASVARADADAAVTSVEALTDELETLREEQATALAFLEGEVAVARAGQVEALETLDELQDTVRSAERERILAVADARDEARTRTLQEIWSIFAERLETTDQPDVSTTDLDAEAISEVIDTLLAPYLAVNTQEFRRLGSVALVTDATIAVELVAGTPPATGSTVEFRRRQNDATELRLGQGTVIDVSGERITTRLDVVFDSSLVPQILDAVYVLQ